LLFVGTKVALKGFPCSFHQ